MPNAMIGSARKKFQPAMTNDSNRVVPENPFEKLNKNNEITSAMFL